MKMLPFILLLLPIYLLAQNRYEVVIDEIMSDPTPRIGLPDNEWIELKNTSTVPINLGGWYIGDASGQSGPMPAYTLQPDSFIIVCTGSAVPALSAFGTVLPVTGFPSLDNNGEILFLKSANGMIIHALDYSLFWYRNDLKKEGGWSLEMTDTKNPCTGDNNWKASTDPNGGTPGRRNSVDAVLADETAPHVKNSFITDNQTIILVFDEPLDSISGAAITNYVIDGGLQIREATTLAPLFNQVQLKVNAPLTENITYTVTANNITDCRGNGMGMGNTARTGIPGATINGDLIINEILFNPRPGAYDYVEIYNKGNRILDASKIYIAERNNGAIRSAKTLSTTPYYIFPGEYFTITEDAESLQLNYLVKNPDKVLVVSSMPSFPDDQGDILLLNIQGEPVDEVKYNRDWHFKLIKNDEAVSLERINPDEPSQQATNWHSAASTAGYGTPTYINSQFRQPPSAEAAIEIRPKIFSPDNDGRDDIATIQYKLNDPGYVANITIFDASGRPVRVLVNNGTMGLSGYWNWDGLNDKGLKLPIATYIIFTEIFNLQGKKKHFKNAIVLGGKLN